MKLLLLTLFVAAATALPIQSEETGPVEVVVVGLPEGQALDLDHVLDVKVNEHVNGQLVSATNALYPFSSEGIQAAIAAQIPEATPIEAVPSEIEAVPEIDSPQPVALPEASLPEAIESAPEPLAPENLELLPEAVVLPQPPTPEIVEKPESVLPEIAMPEAVLPEIAAPETPVAPAMPVAVVEETPEEAVQVVESAINAEPEAPKPEAPIGEVYNDGTVQVTVNAQTGLLATLQSWFDMVVNTFNSQGVQVSNQII